MLAAAMALVAATGCSEALVFPDWTLPVEEGTRVVEYRHVPVEERRATIESAEELVIGDRGDTDVRYAFTAPYSVAVDARGQIYVLDVGVDGIKAFDENGEYLRELGREGQGPGEFQEPRSVVSVGDRLIVGDSGNARWSHFDFDGNHIADHSYPISDNLTIVRATADSGLVGSTVGFSDDGHIVRRFGLYSLQAELLHRLVEVSSPYIRTIMPNARRTGVAVGQVVVREGIFGPIPWASLLVAAGRDGAIYWTMGAEYQILALDPQGVQRWALRVAMTPPALTGDEIDDVMATIRQTYEDATESEVRFPDRQPALGRILVDGHGHLYVFPYLWEGVRTAWTAIGAASSTPISVPVDVYAADGERLFTGMTRSSMWVDADGDHVWEIGRDPATEEYVVRRIRLLEPFE